MDDPRPGPEEGATIGELIVNAQKIKHPFSFAMLPSWAIYYVAQITLVWGMYERVQEDFMDLMVVDNHSKDDWKRMSGPKKRNRFLVEAKKAFPNEPSILAYLETLMLDAGDLAGKRNAIVHGSMTLAVTTNEKMEASYVFQTTSYGLDDAVIQHDLTGEDLENLAHDLGHLAGRAGVLMKLNPDSDGPLSSHDISTLREFQNRNRQNLPMRSMPYARRLSLPA